jgi:alkylation response protein AidB-like acyl-CoA dehydrogenase
MAAGDRLCVLALTEESAEFEPDAVVMRGDPGGRLSGRKLFVKDAHRAHDFIVVVRGARGLDLFLIEADRPGIGRVPMETFSGELLFEVTFDGVETREGDRLGPTGAGWELLEPALRAGALARGAEMVGLAARLLELAVEYARTRVQSGRPIGSFQAIHHYCADMLRHVEGARYLVYRAAWEIDQGADASTAVAMAKAHASEACLAVARKAHQIFGAIGYCEEHVLHRYHKRMLAAGLDFGSAGAHLEMVAQGIGLQGP